MPVDEARQQDQVRDVEPFGSLVARTDAGNVLADDRDVGLEELAREHGQHPTAGKHQVRGLVAAGDGDPADEIALHRRRVAQAARVGCGVLVAVIAPPKPRFRGRIHQVAFFVSLPAAWC